MTRIRILVVDDSVVIRQVIVDALKADPSLEVVGTAANGLVALALNESLKPDVITLDLEMPEMDGLTTLAALRARRSQTPVIVFSSTGEQGARATLDALARGAHDYVCKPSGQRNIMATMERIREELVPKISAVHRKARAGFSRSVSSSPPPGLTVLKPTPVVAGPVELIVIGVSTGGPTALCEVIWHLPRGLRAPILVVQHMPPVFTRVLAQRLAERSALHVREAQHQDRIEPGVVLIAPGDHHMRVSGSSREGWVSLDQAPPQNGCRPAVDPLFESAANAYGRNLLAIVMTGLGHDGTRGATQVRRAGGQVWVQDEASCAAWGMPGSVANAGLATRVVRLHDLAREIGLAAGGVGTSSFPSVRPSPKRLG